MNKKIVTASAYKYAYSNEGSIGPRYSKTIGDETDPNSIMLHIPKINSLPFTYPNVTTYYPR